MAMANMWEMLREIFFRPNKRARKKWIVDQQAALEHFNEVANFNSNLRSKKIEKDISVIVRRYNKRVSELNNLEINVRKRISRNDNSRLKGLAIASEETLEIQRIRKRCLSLKKQIDSLTKQKELVQQQVQQALEVTVVDSDGKLPSRDDAYLDPFVFDGQVESQYAHRCNSLY